MLCRRTPASFLLGSSLALALTVAVGMGCDSKESSSASKTGGKSTKSSASKPADKKMPKAGANDGPFFVVPQDKSTVSETFSVAMGIRGKTVTPAGTDVTNKSLGHHHILVDGKPVPAGTPVPANATSIHYGKGQVETTLTLAPGTHTLTLQFADGTHVSYGNDWSKSITVEVKAGGKERGVSFGAPADGAKVKSPVALKFNVSGMKVRPAGEDILDKTTGHHHIVIDGKAIPTGLMVPADKTNIHYGKGQTEAKVELAKGKHTLTLQFADGAHSSYGPSMSKTITVDVE